MGRLRDAYEAPLFDSVSEEVTDLFGIEDVTLHRFFPADNVSNRDPVWDEPVNQSTVRYKQYKVKAMHLDFQDFYTVEDYGGIDVLENRIWFSRTHLQKAGVAVDDLGEYVGEGDLVEIFTCGKKWFYDIIEAIRTGFVNDTDHYTQYECRVKRNLKYVPERKEYNT